MADSNKDKSISNRSDGDKTKVVKSQNKDNNKVNKRNLKTEGNFKSNSTGNENSSQVCNDVENAMNNQNSTKSASTSDGSSLLGKVIKNRYEVESLIGHGGLCDVYLAKDIILDSSGADNPHVALKILQKEFAEQPETARMLIREAQQTQKLSHPNILRVYDFGVDANVYFLVMEYVDGETLEQLIQRSRPNGLSFSAAMSIVGQALNALDYAHTKGVVHADLKPANIMITPEGNVKLLDFGVSKTHRVQQDKYAARRPSQSLDTLGYTPNYASKPVLEGKEPTFQDDLFAFCCIIYELLSCKHPYNRTPVNEALKKSLKVVKPNNLPFSKWPVLASILNSGSVNEDVNARLLLAKLNKNHLKLITPLAATVILAIGAAYTFQHQQDKISELALTLKKSEEALSEQLDLLKLTATEAKQLIDSEVTVQPVIKEGYLRVHKESILGQFESEIDSILNTSNTSYPNYDQIELVLSNARSYYPDSHKIEVLSVDIQSSKHSTLLSISRQINSHLEKSRYAKEPDVRSIYDLKHDLNTIHREYRFVPSSLASEVFGQQLTEALKEKDAASLVTLLKVGNTFFSGVEEYKDKLVTSNQMKDSILEMKLYIQSLDSNTPLPFPTHAARILYKEDFDGLHFRLEKAKTTVHLDKLVDDLNVLSKRFPENFEDINALKFQIANKYLDFSDILLNKRKAKSARRAMQKANALMQQMERS
ncbi:serine/threonine-protein kinase [Vibrio rotiferianus]|uniref:serine/threonine-protein kinase n=1 Tax=Vibrio rotiferianus TaxID=190895 RepID=UPI0038B2B91F